MTADPGNFGDRHLRADPDGKLKGLASPLRACVRVVLDPEHARSLVGQLGAWLCVNLLARLDGLVAEIELVCPMIETHTLLERLSPRVSNDSSLTATLSELCAAVSAGRARLIEPSVAAGNSVTAQIVLGHGTPSIPDATPAVWCFGSGWLAYAGRRQPAAVNISDSSVRQRTNPLGMYMAVCYAVAEVFKSLRGVREGLAATIEAVYFSLWTGEPGASWDALEDGPTVDSLRLPEGYLIGGGAVGQALALAIATATAGAEFVTVVDEESVDRDNRNRYVLTGAANEGDSKARLVADFLRDFGTPAHAEVSHWLPYTTRVNVHPQRRLAALEQELRYQLILSCVDTNLARHEIQQFWPRDLMGGSTDGLRALAVHYDMRTLTACLACHNPLHDLDREVSRLRREIAGQDPARARSRLLELGIAADMVAAVLEYLERPKCGELGEAAVKKFAEKGPPAFSVGFVSVAAGLLLARHWIRYACLGAGEVCPPERHYLALNFFNGRALWTEQQAREGCICKTEGRSRWRGMWVEGGD